MDNLFSMIHASRAMAARTLRDLRERRGLTGADLAARTGVQQSSVSRAESGAIRLTADALEAVLRELEPTQQERWTIVAGAAWDHRYTRLL